MHASKHRLIQSYIHACIHAPIKRCNLFRKAMMMKRMGKMMRRVTKMEKIAMAWLHETWKRSLTTCRLHASCSTRAVEEEENDDGVSEENILYNYTHPLTQYHTHNLPFYTHARAHTHTHTHKHIHTKENTRTHKHIPMRSEGILPSGVDHLKSDLSSCNCSSA